MKDIVYTFVDNFVYNQQLFAVTRSDLPERDPSTPLVRFGSVSPKQRFEGETEEEVREAVWDSALTHYTRALEHLAAARWLLDEAVTYVTPSRVTKTDTARVTIPVEHNHLTEKDFARARQVAGTMNDVLPNKTVYLGQVGNTSDGRPRHEFEVTYTWQEVTDETKAT